MTTTPRFGATHLTEGQSLASVPVNEQMSLWDALVGLAVLDRDLTAPPGSPSNGDAYIVATGATGAWSTKDGKVAVYRSGWVFFTPPLGLAAWVADEKQFFYYDGTSWVAQTQNVAVVGRNATGGTLTAGTVVTLNNASSGLPSIAKAKADRLSTLPVAGVVLNDVANGANGLVLTRGVIAFDTSGYAAGQTIYASASSSGSVTATKPSGFNRAQVVGIALDSSASGRLLVLPRPIETNTLRLGNSANSSAIANTTTKTDFSVTQTVPANTFDAVGKRLRLRIAGLVSLVSSATFTLELRAGATTLFSQASGTMGTTQTGAGWLLETVLSCRATGASGTLHVASTPILFGGRSLNLPAPADVTVDLTASQALTVAITWSAASASNTITLTDFDVEELN